MKAHKGRGAVSTPDGRFAAQQVDLTGDEARIAAEKKPETVLTAMRAGKIISHNTSPDIPFDRSINPYRGCEHGCVYCYARPTHAWLGLSPGLDFETKLFAKPDAPRLLEAELAKRSYQPATIALGTNTDPYQPIERRLEITRGLLEVLLRG